jgi:hypothetical protein
MVDTACDESFDPELTTEGLSLVEADPTSAASDWADT